MRRMTAVERGREAHLGPHGVGVRRHLLLAVAVGSLRLRGSLMGAEGEGKVSERVREYTGARGSLFSRLAPGRWVLWMGNASRDDAIAIEKKDGTRTCMVSEGHRSLRRPVMRPR